MQDQFSLSGGKKKTIILIAEPESLALALLEVLLSNFFRVKIFAENTDGWNSFTQPLFEGSFLEIKALENLGPPVKVDGLVYIDQSISKLDKQKIKDFLKTEGEFLRIASSFLDDRAIPALFIFPYVQNPILAKLIEENFRKNLSTLNTQSKIVFVGQVFGPRMILSERDLVSRIIKDGLFSSSIRVPESGVVVYPLFSLDAAKEIFKLGIKDFFEKESQKGFLDQINILSGRKQTALEFAQSVSDLCGGKDVVYDKTPWQQQVTRLTPSTYEMQTSLKGLATTLNWSRKNKETLLLEDLNLSQKKVKEDFKIKKFSIAGKTKSFPQSLSGKFSSLVAFVSRFFKKQKNLKPNLGAEKTKSFERVSKNRPFGFVTSSWFSRAVTALFLVVFLPILISILSLGFIYFGQKNLLGGNLIAAQQLFKVVKAPTTLAGGLFDFYAKIPLVGKPFVYLGRNVKIYKKTAEIGVEFTEVVYKANSLMKNILGGESYKVSDYSRDISISLDSIYRELSFVESEFDDLNKLQAFYLKDFVSKFDLAGKRELISVAKNIVDGLPWLLAEGEKRKFLVLLQNNMELRPTGGFIGSFAVVELDAGRLINLNIYDVYSADGQLKGHIEPPEPIKQYLGEANWYLRDSNWDPDFSVSAQRAEWFLDKEMDISVDGVIAIDLELIKDILRITGPLEIADFDKKVDENNIYELTQDEVEKDFFPGSRKKSNFLSALTNSVIEELFNSRVNPFSLAEQAYANLEERHVQIYVHNSNIQDSFSSLGWNGGFSYTKCQQSNCYTDWLGEVEANLGVNKANYFVKRSFELLVYLDEQSIQRTLSIYLSSSANPALGDKGKYSTYLRVLAPAGVFFDSVTIESLGEKKLVVPDIKNTQDRVEAGVFVVVSPGVTEKITFSWASPEHISLSGSGQYLLTWRKQAGAGEDPILIKLKTPTRIRLKSQNTPFLTDGGDFVYNTTLSRDFFSRVFW